jgi:lysozyme family protein
MIPELIAAYNDRWPKTQILPAKQHEVDQVARRLVEARAKLTYQHVENLTGVPWWVVALIHEREANQAWWANIANGEPWNRTTRNVPRGRGPFKSWLDAAKDALSNTPVYTLRRVSDWKDWSAGGALVLLEMYNGFGYELYHHENSPYIWAGTNFQQRGKYVADSHYDPSVWDTQLGCAAMLKRMVELEPDIGLGPLPPSPPPLVA